MRTRSSARALRWLAAGFGTAVGLYATYVGVTWLRYGYPSPPTKDEEDPTLDQFMPIYDIVERHHIRVAAPAEITLAAAREMDLQRSPIARAIFTARETILGSKPETETRPEGLLAFAKSIGWGVLVDAPGRQIIMGAVTKPWEANVVFHALSPPEFVAFNDPGYVKIAWTLRADPSSATESIFRTETRAIATDAYSRRKFRQYWAFASPGIAMIRWLLLQPLRDEAEKRMSHAG